MSLIQSNFRVSSLAEATDTTIHPPREANQKCRQSPLQKIEIEIKRGSSSHEAQQNLTGVKKERQSLAGGHKHHYSPFMIQVVARHQSHPCLNRLIRRLGPSPWAHDPQNTSGIIIRNGLTRWEWHLQCQWLLNPRQPYTMRGLINTSHRDSSHREQVVSARRHVCNMKLNYETFTIMICEL